MEQLPMLKIALNEQPGTFKEITPVQALILSSKKLIQVLLIFNITIKSQLRPSNNR